MNGRNKKELLLKYQFLSFCFILDRSDISYNVPFFVRKGPSPIIDFIDFLNLINWRSRLRGENIHGAWGHWVVYLTSPERCIITFSYSLA